MKQEILDAPFPPPVYLGKCLSDHELNDYYNGHYGQYCRSEINDHLNDCPACLKAARHLIEVQHEAIRKEAWGSKTDRL